MAAALVMAAAKEPDVRAVAGLNGFCNCRKWIQSIYSYAGYMALEKTIAEGRTRFVTEGTRCFEDPFICNLGIDIIYALVDPRIRSQYASGK